MARRRRAQKREVIVDAKFGSAVVAKFMCALMYDGKKSLTETIFYGALDIIQGKMQNAQGDRKNPLQMFLDALAEVKPAVEVRSRRVGGSTYQVPVEVRPERAQALGIRWLITAARSRHEKTMREKLAAEIMDAANKRGTAVKKREDVHRMAEANRAFAHYRW